MAVMTQPTKTGAPPTRDERLASALRENLKRRKAQSRGRAIAASPQSAPPGGESAPGAKTRDETAGSRLSPQSGSD
jgi:hypothetical protein